ncbi:MAG: CFI-box-CTERM domain-containing protein [Nanoarchaeota archaeon]
MGEDKNNKEYTKGVHEGQKGSWFDDVIQDTDPFKGEKSTYDKGYDYGRNHRHDSGSSSGSGGSSGGGCYLTTACVSSIGLSDNCLELSVLRNFRDKILMTEPIGRRAVREYYEMAPEIVQSVWQKDNSRKIWNSVYGDIRKAVSLVLSGDFDKAFDHYRQTTLKLKGAYL